MPSHRDEVNFGELPQYGHQRPPRRQFGAAVLALLTFVSLLIVWRATAGDGNVTARSTVSPPTPGATTQPPAAEGTSQGPTLAPQLQTILDSGHPVYCGGGALPMVALTFDDGPGPYTLATVDTLKAAGAKASFFLVGSLLDTLTNQQTSKAEAKFGDVGDHSWSHFGLAGESRRTLLSEVVRPRNAIRRYTREQVLFFRPPWGSRDRALDAFVKSQGMIEMMWTIDTHDSEGAKADEIVNAIFNQVQPGSIILMHENRATTRDALPAILQVLADKGLQPVSLTTLLTKDPPTTSQLNHGLPACLGS
jgi:peptidoglycan/xylan/chitin deacetylase (PgdA/CDA1 family)